MYELENCFSSVISPNFHDARNSEKVVLEFSEISPIAPSNKVVSNINRNYGIKDHCYARRLIEIGIYERLGTSALIWCKCNIYIHLPLKLGCILFKQNNHSNNVFKRTLMLFNLSTVILYFDKLMWFPANLPCYLLMNVVIECCNISEMRVHIFLIQVYGK